MNLIEAVKTEPLSTIKDLVKSKSIVIDSKYLDYAALNTALECGKRDIAKFLLDTNCRVSKKTKPAVPTDTPLHNATKLGDLELVNAIIKKKAPFTINCDGNTPLHLAFLYKHEHIVDFMLRLMAQNSLYINNKNGEGLSHLHIACTRKHKQVVEGFLKAGAVVEEAVSPSSIRWPGYNAFHFAAESKSLPAIQILTSNSDWRSFDKKNAAGKTPLQLVREHLQEVTVMESLLSRKKFSCFHLACTQRYPSDLKTFLDNGVDVNDEVSFLAGFCPKDTPLHCVVNSRCPENVKLMLKCNPDVSARNELDMTPLHLAMYKNVGEVVNLLYKATDFENQDTTVDKNGLNFFHVACSQNDIETAKKFILDKGGNVDAQVLYDQRIFSRYTALHFAVHNKHLEMVEWLIQNGADVNLGADGVDGTPLHLAFVLGHVDIVELLLKNGADPKAVRKVDDRTTLHLLVYRCTNQFEAEKTEPLLPYIEKLIELGVDVNAQDEDGNTALHVASERVYCGFSCLRLLLEFGADVNVKNDKGYTPFDLNLTADIDKELVQPGDYTILYHHVQKLKALRMNVNPQNDECCRVLMSKKKHDWDLEAVDFKEEELKRMQKARVDEISKLKSAKVVELVSVYDFLHLRVKIAAEFATSSGLVNLMKDESFREQFPVYGFMIKLQHRKAVSYVRPKDGCRKDSDDEEEDKGSRVKRRRVCSKS